MEKEAMERHQKDLLEQELAEKVRSQKRIEGEEQSRVRLIKIMTLKDQQADADQEVEQLTELIRIKE